MAGKTYGIRELQGLAGVQARTLRHWIRQRLLPKPLGVGRGARYTEQHVLRARAILHLRGQRRSLPAIRKQLGQLSDEQVLAMLPRTSDKRLTAEGLPQPPPAPTYPSVTWEVVTLMEGLVLLVDSQRAPGLRRIADDIYRYYGGLPAPRRMSRSDSNQA